MLLKMRTWQLGLPPTWSAGSAALGALEVVKCLSGADALLKGRVSPKLRGQREQSSLGHSSSSWQDSFRLNEQRQHRAAVLAGEPELHKGGHGTELLPAL